MFPRKQTGSVNLSLKSVLIKRSFVVGQFLSFKLLAFRLDPAITMNVQLALCGATAGLLSHWFYFINGEHHVSAPKLAHLAIVVPASILISLWKLFHFTPFQATNLTAQAVFFYYSSLWTSIIVYRVCFHRLRAFPGPIMAKASKLWHVAKLIPAEDNYHQLDELHKQYGEFVRTGKTLNLRFYDDTYTT